MTRDTKIGLLVGLAFVIVLGILITDHISSANEPAGAPLQAAADMLRSGLGQPGSDDVAPMLRVPTAIAPSQVVTHADLKREPPVRFVNQHGNAITPDAPGDAGLTSAERLRLKAMQQGEPLVPVNGLDDPVQGNTAPSVPQPKLPVVPKPPQISPRNYEAQTGDSLGLIARKEYGSGCKANRDAIVAANPSLAQNRDMIVAGRTYIIPPIAGAVAPAGTTPAVVPTKPVTPVVPAPPVDVAPVAKAIVYVVQPNDTLWSIAVAEVGTPSAVAAIEDLNQDVLNGNESLRPNMRLKLPAKKNPE